MGKRIMDQGEYYMDEASKVESVEFSDGASGLVLKLHGQKGWSLCTPEDSFSIYPGMALAGMRAEVKAGDDNIPTKYYKKMRKALDNL